MNRRRLGPWPLLSAGALAGYGVVVVLPLAWIGWTLATTFAQTDFGRIFGARPMGLLWNSLAVAGGTTAFAVILGVPLALLLVRLRVPGRTWLLLLSLLPVIVPLPLRGIAWNTLCLPEGLANRTLMAVLGLESPPLDPYGMDGVILVLGMAWFPVVLWTTAFGLLTSPRELEEDARMDAGAGRVLEHVSLRLAMPSIALGALVVFALALAEFDIPLLLNVNVYPVQVFTYFNTSGDLAGAVRACLPLFAMLLVLGWLGLRVARRLKVERYTLNLERPGLLENKALCWIAFALVLLIVLGPLLLDFSVLLDRAGGDWDSYVEAWTAAADETWWSFATCSLATGLMVLLALGLAGPHRARPYPGPAWLFLLLPLFIPGPVLGLALKAVWNQAWLTPLYDSIWMMVIAATLRYLPLALLVIIAGLSLWPRQLEEVASVEGAGETTTLSLVFLPLILPALLAAGGLAFILTLLETATTIMVVPPGKDTLALRLHQFMHYGPDHYVAALTLGLTGLVLILALLVMAVIHITARRAERS